MLHQSADAEDFAEPTMSFDYGDHTLKVVATRSETPTLQSADGSLWTLADTPAFAMTAVAGPLAKVHLHFGTFVLWYVCTFVPTYIYTLVLINFRANALWYQRTNTHSH